MALDIHFTYDDQTVKSLSITHNLRGMADELHISQLLWKMPETTGKDLGPLIEQALKELEADPKRFEPFNPPNGWGDYETLVEFLYEIVANCKKYPNSNIYSFS